MWSKLRRLFWKTVALISPQSWLEGIWQRRLRALRAQLEGKLTDKFVELLLAGMELAFLLLPSYRRNLRRFHGSYVLRTADGRVAASALFADGRMAVRDQAVLSPTVTVTFATPAALRRFLFSQDQDILDSLMANEVEVDGNVTYIYKLGYMARDLTMRLGIA
jgi:hypothetical protein